MPFTNSNEHIQTELSHAVLTILLNRPVKRNALTNSMYTALGEIFTQAEKDDAVRVVLLTGGNKDFTTGNDITDFQKPRASEQSYAAEFFFPALRQLTKPVIAAVNGYAVGIGTTMLLHCDLVYAGQGTKFRLPFVNLGLCPEFGSSFLLPQLMGHQRASELLLLGNFFDATMAREVGIVTSVCIDEEVLNTAVEKARQLAEQPPAAVRLTKYLLKRTNETLISETIKIETMYFRERTESPEAGEAFEAFAQRRKPDFSSF
jgi:enoyl-CoA hydratase/carnithine racemase